MPCTPRFAELVVLSPVVIGWLSLQVVSDVIITSMCYGYSIFLGLIIWHLISVSLTIILARSRTGFRKTDTVLNKLIRGAVQTGLFAGIFSIGDLICFLKVPETNLYGMFAIPIGRIYTNVRFFILCYNSACCSFYCLWIQTLLDTLLTRDELREQLSSVKEIDSSVSHHSIPGYVPWHNQPNFLFSHTKRRSYLRLFIQ